MLNKSVTVIGAGNGGLALAAHLSLNGYKVGLWSYSQYNQKLCMIKKYDGIIKLEGKINHDAKIAHIFEDLESAVNFSDVIFNCLPTFSHDDFITDIIDFVKEKKIIINFSGCFSSISQYSKINNLNSNKLDLFKLFDTSTFPYACRYVCENRVNILGVKQNLPIASLFSKDEKYIKKIQKIIFFTKLEVLNDTLTLGLYNTNSTFHPPTVLFNAARIDNGDKEFYFYKDGISKKTVYLHEKLEEERLYLGQILNIPLKHTIIMDNEYYDTDFSNIYDFCKNSRVHNSEKMVPNSLAHRYIYEDVKYGLVALYSLAKMKNIILHNIESVIRIFSTICGEEFLLSGRIFEGLNITDINKFIVEK